MYFLNEICFRTTLINKNIELLPAKDTRFSAYVTVYPCMCVCAHLINQPRRRNSKNRKKEKNEANSETSGRGGFDPQKNDDKEEEEGIKEDSSE